MYSGNLLERARSLCEHVFLTYEYTLGYYEIYLRSCVLNHHKLRKSQIATIQESLPSQFVICRNFWSRPWRHKLSPITLKTCSAYLGEIPRFTFDMIMKSCIFTHCVVISLVYLSVCMYISYKAHNRCTQEYFLKGSDFNVNMFSALRSIPSVTMKSIWEVVFWTVSNCDSHKIATIQVSLCRHGLDHKFRQITNCDNSGIPAVAICDLSQFVIKAVTAQTESNNIENVFCVLGRVPMITFHRNLRDCVLTHFRIICHTYSVWFTKHEVPEWT